MEHLALAILVIGLIHLLIKKREAKERGNVHSVLHIQAKTEEAETMDFAINLLKSESNEDHSKKIDQIFAITELRRRFNNDRLNEIMKAHEEHLKSLKK